MPHLSHQSLLRVKALLSSAFTYAKQEDAIREANPMQGVKVEGRRYKPVRQAYTLEDIHAMLAKLPEPARTVIMVAGFAGLRLSEIRGLRWEDYNGMELLVSRSAWRTHIGPTKTEQSGENPVPVIPILQRARYDHTDHTTSAHSTSIEHAILVMVSFLPGNVAGLRCIWTTWRAASSLRFWEMRGRAGIVLDGAWERTSTVWECLRK